jgi:hypothetical protein
MLEFHPFQIEHRGRLLPYLRKHSQTCDRTFTNLFCWQHFYHARWAETDDWLVVRANINGERRVAYIPISKTETPYYPTIIPLLEEEATNLHQSLTLMGLSGTESALLKEQCPNDFIFDNNRDFADYIYLAEALRTLKGRKYAQKRNHVNKFKSLYHYRYVPIHQDNIQDCLTLEESWLKQHDDDHSAVSEYETIRRALENFDALELSGGILYVDDQVIAFTYGSAINDRMFGTHVEKADIRYEGSYQMINYLFAQHLPAQYTLINREEDLGLAGLRKAKMSYEPIQLAYKTTAVKITPEMRDIMKIWGKCFGETDESVYTFLSRYYFNHCTLTEKVDGHVVSMVFMIPCQTAFGKAAYLYGIATDPSYQKQGISSKLIQEMLTLCKEKGFRFSFLIPEGPSTITFYEKFGYQATQTHAVFTNDMDLGTGDKEKDRIMILPLDVYFRIEQLPEILESTPML